MILDKLKEIQFYQNSAYDYIMALALFIGLLLALKIFQLLIVSRLKKVAQKTKTDLDDAIIEIFDNLKPPFYFLVAFYLSVKLLVLPLRVHQVITVLFIIVVVFEVIKAFERILDYFINKHLAKSKSEEGDIEANQTMVYAIRTIFKIIIWVFGIVLILSNLGIDITSLIAGLGIGGVAVALALQNILGDIFSSFSIYLDKPFRVGDFIVVGADKGTVEKIGLKTTRIRSIQGEELIISNNELTTARVQNFKRLNNRRVSFKLGVVYGTLAEKLEAIPKMIQDIVSKEKEVDFDRCYFVSYGDFSLDFEIVYFVKSDDFKVHLEIQQRILLEIYKKFAEEKITFAYPTQTVYLNK